MSVYIIRHGRILCADYEMDIVYYPKAHLHGLGFKWDGDAHLYLNHATGQWAAIDRFSEAKDAKIKPDIARVGYCKWVPIKAKHSDSGKGSR
jgi:hypothetical protein